VDLPGQVSNNALQSSIVNSWKLSEKILVPL